MGNLAGMLLPAVAGLVAGGGLQRIIGQFESHGLAGAAGSWVGKGENQSVTPDGTVPAEHQVAGALDALAKSAST